MIIRTIKCDICGREEAEAAPNAGWLGWGGINGESLNGCDNPTLCPVDLAKVAVFVDSLTKEN